jgi:hypothetical protein
MQPRLANYEGCECRPEPTLGQRPPASGSPPARPETWAGRRQMKKPPVSNRDFGNAKPLWGTERGALARVKDWNWPLLATGAILWPQWDSRAGKDSFGDSSTSLRTHFLPSTGLICGSRKCKKPQKILVFGAPCGRVVGDIGLDGSWKQALLRCGTLRRTPEPEFTRT